ncbi:MAG TPA: M56 family metallopeptidase, partial [Flavobacteriaceae bacterium]|nr:M56 family metallopeptidase [Flavobacteriaceae bacterium]
MIAYLIQLLVFQALFLAVYELFLKKETFFSLNRAYLLVTPFVAAILPVLEFEILREAVPVENMVQLPVLLLSGANPELSETSAEMFASYPSGLLGFMETNWLLLIYLLGVLVALALFLKKYTQLLRIKKSGKTEKHGKINLVHIPSNRIASTFFNTVFLGENLSEVEKKQILAHELVHVGQRHSYDLMLFELLRIFLWFNPFIYRYQSQLSTLHEYIADEKTTQNSTQKDYFQELLNTAFGTRQIPFCNAFFNKSLIKKLIVMMKKPKSNRNAKLKYLLIFPLILGMLTYVACSQEQDLLETETIERVKTFEMENLKTTTEKQKTEILNHIHKIGSELEKVIVKDNTAKISFVYTNSNWDESFIQITPDGKVNFKSDKIIVQDSDDVTTKDGDGINLPPP